MQAKTLMQHKIKARIKKRWSPKEGNLVLGPSHSDGINKVLTGPG